VTELGRDLRHHGRSSKRGMSQVAKSIIVFTLRCAPARKPASYSKMRSTAVTISISAGALWRAVVSRESCPSRAWMWAGSAPPWQPGGFRCGAAGWDVGRAGRRPGRRRGRPG